MMIAEDLPWLMENKHGLNANSYWNAWATRMLSRHDGLFEDMTSFPLPAKEFSEKFQKRFVFSGNMKFGEKLYFVSFFQISEDLHFYTTYAVKDSPDQLIVFLKCFADNPAIWRDFLLENQDLFIDPNVKGMGFGDHGGGFGG